MVTVVVPTDWTSILTAVGTVGATIAAVGIAIWSDSRTGKRLRDQLEHSDGQLRRQFEHSDADLVAERTRAAKEIADERAHAQEVREEERRLAREQEQLTEAWSVQVIGARMASGPGITSQPDNPAERPVAIVFNHGRYTITRVQAQFSPGDDSLVGTAQAQSFTDLGTLPYNLGHDLTGVIGQAHLGVIERGGALRFIGDTMLVRYLHSIFPIVRWTDRWGTRWEHRQGQVRQIDENAPWIGAR